MARFCPSGGFILDLGGWGFGIGHGIGQKFQFWALIKFLDLEIRVGAYSRWALIHDWAIIEFSPFSASAVCLFCNKTINANKKTRRSNKARFL